MADIGCGGVCKQLERAVEYMNDVFHYEDFKSDIQKEAVAKILKREDDVFISLPNGFGRALCYQLPAALRAGYQATFIIHSLDYRLRAHFKDLRELGVPCELLDNRTLQLDDYKILRDLRNGTIRPCLIYASLEVACMDNVRELISFLREKNRLAYVVLDETHSRQNWQENKYEYIYENLGTYRLSCPEVPWIVVLGKVRPNAIESLQNLLRLKIKKIGYSIYQAPAFRPNIYYECVIEESFDVSIHNLKEFIKQHLNDSKSAGQSTSKNGSGIIFCKNRDQCIEISSLLGKSGISIAPHYTGLNDEEYIMTLNAFITNTFQVLTVTSTSGATIDKTDLRFVVHWGLPVGLLAYYCQTAVAGKDGKFARCRIYVTQTEIDYYQKSRELELKKNACHGDYNEKIKFHLYMNTSMMKDYCVNLQCRHSYIANYFSDVTPKCINKCDVCVAVNDKGRYVFKKLSESLDDVEKDKKKTKVLTKQLMMKNNKS